MILCGLRTYSFCEGSDLALASNVANLPKRTSGMDATIRHLVEHPRVRFGWRHE